jgi:hypothetical protein
MVNQSDLPHLSLRLLLRAHRQFHAKNFRSPQSLGLLIANVRYHTAWAKLLTLLHRRKDYFPTNTS